MSIHPKQVRNWKVDLGAAWIAQFLCLVGFDAALPFMPFYIRDLGVTDPGQVNLWVGLVSSAGPITMSLMSPLWGVLADRRGRKLMVERAAFGGAVTLSLMAFASNVQQLFLLRLIQGAFTGTVPAFVTLVASFTPATEMGFALGMMQMAVFMGASVGPLVGGLVADQFGYRWAFLVPGVMLMVAGVMVNRIVGERCASYQKQKAAPKLLDSAHMILRSTPILGAIVALGGVYMATQASRPLIPLLVEILQPNPQLVNTAVGMVYGAGAIASAISAVVVGRISDKAGHRTALVGCTVGAALAYLGQAYAPSVNLLVTAAFGTGLFFGGLAPATNAILASTVPKEQQGTVYGISNSVSGVGRIIGPMIGSAVATGAGLRISFVTTAGLLAVVAVWVAAAMRRRQGPNEHVSG